MKLKRLLKDIPQCSVKGSKDIAILGLASNSKVVVPGDLFIAKKGTAYDGVNFITEAIHGGAVAVATDLFDPFLRDVAQIIHPNVASIEATLASTFYETPSNELFLVGITGTNGKTTTSYIIKFLLDAFYGPCGLIGTIEYIVGTHHYPATRTTPGVTMNHQLLREMCVQKCRSAVMEVTSHALDQGRVEKLDFDVAVFTNLTQDHLDYHKTVENYAKAKQKLFCNLGSSKNKHQKYAIVNVDNPWHKIIVEETQAQILTYGIDGDADLKATSISVNTQGTRCQLTYKDEQVPFSWPLTGRFNIYNCLAAIAVLLSRGVELSDIAKKIVQLTPVRGRLQRVSNDLDVEIYVDFAHSPDALKKVLETIIEYKRGKIITVFGCGGDRDREKRPLMAEISGKLSDYTIVTSDNPRTEDPLQICHQIIAGFNDGDLFEVEVDRKTAIERAITMANKNDTILVAGRGHESTQIFAHQAIEFDDAKVVSQICNRLAPSLD